ncbi:MAG: AAA family ATPase [Clostridia bacterium]|nr:AAA family ATPase [Clostridia bacterium]
MEKEIQIYMQQKGFEDVKAFYDVDERSVRICQGTIISDQVYDIRNDRRREDLKQKGYIVGNKFVKDYIVNCKRNTSEFYTALSTASSIILGRSSTGFNEFFTYVDGEKVFMYKYFLEWYIGRHIHDECDFTLDKQKERIDKFKQEFPFEDFLNLEYERYHKIKDDNNLAYKLEYGEYANLGYTSIRGLGIEKLGFYQQEKEDGLRSYYYFDQKISDSNQLNNYWSKVRETIYEILKLISENKIDDIEKINDAKIDKISPIIVKLASIYFPDNIIQISIKDCINKLYNLIVEGNEDKNILYKSMKIKECLNEKFPEVDPYVLSKILYEYYIGKFSKNNFENKKYWLIAAGENSKYWEEFKAGNYIAIGWNDIGALDGLKIKREIAKKYEEVYGKKAPNDICALWDFYGNMSKGDVVFVKSGLNKIIAYGEISGDYYFDDKFDYKHKRSVIWKSFDNFGLSKDYKMCEKTLTELKKEYELTNYLISVYEDEIKELENNSDLDRYLSKNTIIYGVPGCGKSRKVVDLLKGEEYVRVLFHPEYTYSDFIGQVMPVVKDEKITYEFVPGPFTKILEEAIKTNESSPSNFFLVIEEINRGNAPAIFGDVFQLLDRNKDGVSEYKINNKDIAKHIFNDEDKKIYIPSNLTIFATMNTCDQNVFTMDTAFKRRWRMERIENNFESAEISNCEIDGLSIQWGEFATIVNDLILNLNDGFNSEDKQLGVYFVKEDEIRDIKAFAEKVLMYLWDDVVKYDKTQLFKPEYKTLDSLINAFVKGENVFKSDVMEGLYNRSKNVKTEEI